MEVIPVAHQVFFFLRIMRQICESVRRIQTPAGATEPVQGGNPPQ